MKPDKTTDSSQMFDSLVGNALGFLQRSVEELKRAPNHSAIDFCTAIELFLKARLLSEHWTLVCVDLKKATLHTFRRGNCKSVGMTDAIARLRDWLGLNISKEAEDTFARISQHRNKLIHFFHPSFSQRPDAIEIASVVAEQCRGWYYLHLLLTDSWRSIFASYAGDLKRINGKMHQNRSFLTVKYEARSKNIEELKAKGIVINTCRFCGFEAMRRSVFVGPFWSLDCLVCETTVQGLVLECPTCGASPSVIGGVCSKCSSPIILAEVLKAYAPLEENRALCGNRNCLEVLQESDSYEESVSLFDDKWVCLVCFTVDEHTWNCTSCGRRIAGEPNGSLCFECDLKDDHVWPPIFGGIM